MSEAEFIKAVCDRLAIAIETTGLNKRQFGARIGLSSQQVSNALSYRTAPKPLVIDKICAEFGFTTDYFYRGIKAGMRDPALSDKITEIERRSVTSRPVMKTKARKRKSKHPA